jgi:predicted amidohydrolase
MKIGFLQFNPQFGKKEENFRTVESLLTNIDADLIVLPELFSTGYTFLDTHELKKYAEPGTTGETAEFMISCAKKHNCFFSYGFAEQDDDALYNSAAIASTHGIVGIYRKNHLFFEERKLFQPGNLGFPVYTIDRCCVGMLVCYDWLYPEAMRTLAMKGAQIILHSANLVMPYCPDAHKTRAIENRVFIVMANRTGIEHRGTYHFEFIGQSEIVAPDGTILIRAQSDECVEIKDIDPQAALNKQVNAYNSIFEDRRADIYFK